MGQKNMYDGVSLDVLRKIQEAEEMKKNNGFFHNLNEGRKIEKERKKRLKATKANLINEIGMTTATIAGEMPGSHEHIEGAKAIESMGKTVDILSKDQNNTKNMVVPIIGTVVGTVAGATTVYLFEKKGQTSLTGENRSVIKSIWKLIK